MCAQSRRKDDAASPTDIAAGLFIYRRNALLIDDERDGESTRCVLCGALNGEICSALRGDYDPRSAAVMTPAKYRDEKHEQRND